MKTLLALWSTGLFEKLMELQVSKKPSNHFGHEIQCSLQNSATLFPTKSLMNPVDIPQTRINILELLVVIDINFNTVHVRNTEARSRDCALL
jgi:hypothetical protein